MAYAADIISNSFEKTKQLFFPIRKDYWFKMGLVSLFGGSNSSSGSGNFGSSNSNSDANNAFKGMTIQEILARVNHVGLEVMSKYGTIIGILFAVLFFVCQIFSYIGSIMTFVFLDGIVKKEIKIRKSMSETKTQAISLFLFRLVVGLISLAGFILCTFPIISAFFNNTLAEFNFWLLIPIGLGLIIFYTVFGIFLFLVNDFVVPFMYLKKYTFNQGWEYFLKLSSGKKGEIFMYWLIKLGLSIAGGIMMIFVLIPILLVFLLLVLLGVGIYLLTNAFAGSVTALIITIIYGVIVFILFLIAVSVITVPIPSFFTVYSLEMIKKLEGKEEIVAEKSKMIASEPVKTVKKRASEPSKPIRKETKKGSKKK
jgi:hypothetical protein